VFENRVLRRIFGRKREEVTKGARKLNRGLGGRIILKWLRAPQNVRV
jgi:hypothetical protein